MHGDTTTTIFDPANHVVGTASNVSGHRGRLHLETTDGCLSVAGEIWAQQRAAAAERKLRIDRPSKSVSRIIEINCDEIQADVLIPGLEGHVGTLTLAIDPIVPGDVAAAS